MGALTYTLFHFQIYLFLSPSLLSFPFSSNLTVSPPSLSLSASFPLPPSLLLFPSFLPQSVDPWADPALVDSVEFLEEKLQVVPRLIVAIVALLAIVMPFLVDYWARRGEGSTDHRKENRR